MGQVGFSPTANTMDVLDARPELADEAFGTLLFKQFGDRLFDFAYVLTRDYDVASSIVEMVIIQVAQQTEFTEQLTIANWLYSDVCEAAFEWLANKRRLPPESRVTELSAPPDIITRADQSAMVWQAVCGFGERDQAMIALYIRHHMSLRDVSRVLGFGSSALEMMLDSCLERVTNWLGTLLLLDYLVQHPEAAIPENAEPLLDTLEIWDGHFTPLVHQKTAEWIAANNLTSWRDSVVPNPVDLLAEQALTPAPYQILHAIRDKLQALTLLATMPPPPQPTVEEQPDYPDTPASSSAGVASDVLAGSGGTVEGQASAMGAGPSDPGVLAGQMGPGGVVGQAGSTDAGMGAAAGVGIGALPGSAGEQVSAFAMSPEGQPVGLQAGQAESDGIAGYSDPKHGVNNLVIPHIVTVGPSAVTPEGDGQSGSLYAAAGGQAMAGHAGYPVNQIPGQAGYPVNQVPGSAGDAVGPVGQVGYPTSQVPGQAGYAADPIPAPPGQAVTSMPTDEDEPTTAEFTEADTQALKAALAARGKNLDGSPLTSNAATSAGITTINGVPVHGSLQTNGNTSGLSAEGTQGETANGVPGEQGVASTVDPSATPLTDGLTGTANIAAAGTRDGAATGTPNGTGAGTPNGIAVGTPHATAAGVPHATAVGTTNEGATSPANGASNPPAGGGAPSAGVKREVPSSGPIRKGPHTRNGHTKNRLRQRRKLVHHRLRKLSLLNVVQLSLVSGVLIFAGMTMYRWMTEAVPSTVADPVSSAAPHDSKRVPGKITVQEGSLKVENGVVTSMLIANTGATALDWKVVNQPDWINVNVSSGSLTPGQIAVINVSKVANVHEGTQSGNIDVHWDGITNGDVKVPVETSVINPPIIGTFSPQKMEVTTCDEPIPVTVEAGDETGVAQVQVQTFIPGTEVKFMANLTDRGPIDTVNVPKLPIHQPGSSIAQPLENGHVWEGTIGPFKEAGTYSVAVIAQDDLGADIEANRGHITVTACPSDPSAS